MGRWKFVGNSPELLARAQIPAPRVAFTLYDKDEPVRQIPVTEIFNYPEMIFQNIFGPENWLRDHFAEKR